MCDNARPMDCVAPPRNNRFVSTESSSDRRSKHRLARGARCGLWLLLLVSTLAFGLAGCSSATPASTAPTITSLSQTSGAVGTSITITGTNFGAAQGTSTVTFNGTAATTITSWSAASIVATVPAGATTGNIVVTVAGVVSNGVSFVVPAVITSLSQTSGAVGTAITITGTNFGAAQGTSTVTFNGTAAAVASAWGATSITVTVPAGATSGNVVVTVSGVASNGSPFTVSPGITSLSQTSGAVGASITITGTNFGATQSTSTVTFNGTAAAAASAWSATGIAVLVPVGATSGNVVVTVGGLASNGSPFTIVLPPAITSLSQTSGAVGVSVAITGTNFGAAQGSSTVTFNGTAAGAATAWSATSITVKVPAGASTGNVVVNVLGSASNGSPFTIILAPAITSLSQTSGAIGVSVTITGTNFGAAQGTSTVTFNGTVAAPATAWSATSITVLVPVGASSGNVVVTVLGAASNNSPFAVVLPPTITSLSQTSGAVGVSITITGTNFGAAQGASTVAFNGTAAAAASAWSATSITVLVPAGASTGSVVVNVLGSDSNGSPFTIILAPAITTLSQPSGAVGTSITITGTSFGAAQGTSTVTFNGTAAAPASAWSATSITVLVPVGATTGNVVVTVLGAASNGSPFTVPPTITTLSQTSGAVGASISITGTNFGATQSTSTVTLNGTAAAAASAWSTTSITVLVPVGATTGNVVVTVGGLASNGSPFTVVLPPSLTSLSQTSGAVGTSITLTGTSFGASQSTSTVTFNGLSGGVATSWGDTSITINVPVGATTGNVVVTVAGTASNGLLFTVAPVITSLSQTSGAVGVSVTITGSNFGSTQSTSTVTFNGTTAAAASAWSATSITVLVPVGATTGNVIVTVGGQGSNGSSFTVVLPPAVTLLSQTTGSAGTSVTITGSNFGSTQSTSTVTFNGTAAAAASAWSDTSITVTVPAGATTGNVVVTVLGTASATSGSTLFTVTASCTSNCTLSGTVTGPWVSGVTITIVGPTGGSTTSDSSGNYSFTGLTSGSYTITPALAGYTYSPTSLSPTINANTTNQNFAATSAITSFSIQGTIKYFGAQAGTTIVRVFQNGCTGCGTIAGTSISTAPTSAGTSYIVRGLPSGSYIVDAEIDTQHTESQNSSDPVGNSTTQTITSSNVTLADFTVADRTPPSPTVPDAPNVFPSSGAALIVYNQIQDNNGEELATSYQVSYGTDTSASNLGTISYPAGNTQDVLAVTGLTNTTAYYFKIAAVNGSGTSAYSSIVGPITVGATTGLNTVSGTVTFTGITATGRLNIGLFSSTNGVYFVSFTSPVSGQAWSVAGVPSGTYALFAFLDQNNCNYICVGDVSNFITKNGPPLITISGTSSGNSIALTAFDASTFVTTNHTHFGTESYNINVGVNIGEELPVSMTLFSGPNAAAPFDMSADQNDYSPIFNNSVSPIAGQNYGFQVAFAGGSTESIPATVTGVLSFPTQFAQTLAMNTSGLFTRNIPQLTWAAPSSSPTPIFFYQVEVDQAGGGQIWQYKGGHDGNGLPSSTTSVTFNTDGKATQSSLTTSTTYNWSVTVIDANGNTGTFTTTFTP